MISSNDDKLKLYEHQLQDMTSKFTDEMRIKEEKVSRQNAELETKSSTIASLTQQLYNTRIRLRSEIETNARIASGAICNCPHCRAHHRSRPTSRSSTDKSNVSADKEPMRTSRIERRRVRTVSSPVPDSIADQQEQDGLRSSTGSIRLPTPPSLPKPPTKSSIRRASIPIRRQLPFMSASVREPTTTGSTTSLPGGRHPRPDENVLEQRALDPVKMYRYGTVPTDIRQLLHSREGDVRIVSKPAPPVLPPITLDDNTKSLSQTEILNREDTQLSNELEYASYSELPTSNIRLRRHRHFILAQAQGLSSAPSTMRVLRYHPHSLEPGLEDVGTGRPREAEEEFIGEEGAAEGTLLVRETVNRKDQGWRELHQHGTK